MVAWRLSHALVLLLALVVVLSSSTDASKWARKSADVSTPLWRRSTEYGAHSPTPSHEAASAELALDAHRRELAGEDEYGPALFDTVLSLYVPLRSSFLTSYHPSNIFQLILSQ